MPKYMYAFSYSPEGLQGLLKEGGSSRREAAREISESLGGRLESYYFAWGETDGYAVAELPDDAAAAALAVTVSASGKVRVSTTKLIEPEEMDEAVNRSTTYRPPGS
jgi:uncharacterized protein with GYD domain